MLEVAPITVKVEFPALDNLVDYLRNANANPIKEAIKEAVKPELKVVEAKKEKPAAVKEAPKAEPKPEPVPEPAPEPVEEVKEEEPVKHWAPDEVAGMAMHLRDIDKAYSAKVKEHFPEVGIKSLGDIRSNDEACQKLAAILVRMTAEAEG